MKTKSRTLHCNTLKGGYTVLTKGLLIFCGKKSKISRDFQGQIRGKIGRFSREKSQDSRHKRPISGDFRGREVKIREKLAHFAGF